MANYKGLEELTTSVHLSGPNNSTFFTDCCGCAVADRDTCCPKCGRRVEEETGRDRWAKAYGRFRERRE
jgi:hypothetical protein